MRFYVTRGGRRAGKRKGGKGRLEMAARDTGLRYIVGGRSFLSSPKGAVTIVTSRSCISARPIDADWLLRYMPIPKVRREGSAVSQIHPGLVPKNPITTWKATAHDTHLLVGIMPISAPPLFCSEKLRKSSQFLTRI